MTKEIILTDSQNKAVSELLEWTKIKLKTHFGEVPDEESSVNNTIRTLSGSAGTGKTTIVDTLISKLDRHLNVCVTAPTHKAKTVISKMTGLSGRTIHSLLGLKPNVDIENFDINRPVFDELSPKEISEYDLIIVDECSMISKDLKDIIEKDALKYKTKILFVGDKKQVGPVNNKHYEEISETFNYKGVELTEIVRQKNSNPLNMMLSLLVNDITSNTDTFNQQLKNKDIVIVDDEGYGVFDSNAFYIELEKYFNKETVLIENKVKYLAFSNRNIALFNKYIRQILFQTRTPAIIDIGDLIMCYKQIITGSGKHQETVYNNAEELEVLEIIFSNNKYGINIIYTKVRSLSTGRTFDLPIVNPNSYKEFVEKFNDFLETAIAMRGSAWKTYYEFKQSHILLETLVDSNEKTIIEKDIDFGYGITIHKSQGSTYENVFINLDDIKKFSHVIGSEQMRKLLYVGVSRTKGICLILNNHG